MEGICCLNYLYYIFNLIYYSSYLWRNFYNRQKLKLFTKYSKKNNQMNYIESNNLARVL